MNDRLNGDDEMLARLVREAGDPSVSPDPRYADALKAAILARVAPNEAAEPVREAGEAQQTSLKRTRKMKRIAKLAVAATVLVALGILVSWMSIGCGSSKLPNRPMDEKRASKVAR